MKTYFVEVLCSVEGSKFVESHIAVDTGFGIVMQGDKAVHPEYFENWKTFKNSLVHNDSQFHKYVNMTFLGRV